MPDSRTQSHLNGLAPEAIKSQLNRILTSPTFLSSAQLGRFLRYVIEETLAGRGDQIKQYTIAVRAYGYPANFDPRTDTVVRVHARRLRRALAIYYEKQGAHDPIVIAIPKGTYVPLITTSATAPDQIVARSASVQPSLAGPSFKNQAKSLANAHFVGGFSTDYPSIGVLQFTNINGRGDWTALPLALTEDIIIALTGYANYHILGPLSTASTDIDVPGSWAIGRKTGARFLLTGSTQQEDDQLRIRVRLIDCPLNRHVWTACYDYTLTDHTLLSICDALSQKIAADLVHINRGIIPRLPYREANRKPVDDLSALEALSFFTYYIDNLSDETLRRARTALVRSTRVRPHDELLGCLLSEMQIDSYALGLDETDHLLGHALDYSQQAAQQNPRDGFRQLSQAYTTFYLSDQERFIKAADLALQQLPDSPSLGILGLLLVASGQYERGIALAEKVKMQHPDQTGSYHGAFYLYHYNRGEYEQALQASRQYHQPNWFWQPLAQAAALGQLNRQTEVSKTVTALRTLRPDFKDRGRDLIRRGLPLLEQQEMIIEGLAKAGLRLAS